MDPDIDGLRWGRLMLPQRGDVRRVSKQSHQPRYRRESECWHVRYSCGRRAEADARRDAANQHRAHRHEIAEAAGGDRLSGAARAPSLNREQPVAGCGGAPVRRRSPGPPACRTPRGGGRCSAGRRRSARRPVLSTLRGAGDEFVHNGRTHDHISSSPGAAPAPARGPTLGFHLGQHRP